MKKILPLGVAVNGTISILSCTILFHCLVLAGIIPYTIVWGGNITDKNQLYIMEAVSIALNGIMLLVMLIFSGYIKLSINPKIIKIAIGLMSGLFLLNTIGNLLAKQELETYIFSPITLLLSLFCFRIAAFERPKKTSS